MLDRLRELARLTADTRPSESDVLHACRLVRDALGADDAYVIRAGDPFFTRIGCPCPPADYEIKQKGYWLIWREAVEHPENATGIFTVEDRLVAPGRPTVAGRPATHLATLLPGNESNAEMLVVRGPWPNGLTAEQVAFAEVARPVVAQIVSNLLDVQRQSRQRDQLESLASIAKAFSEASADENVLGAVATAVAKASGFDWVVMAVYDDEGKRIVDRAMNRSRHYNTETAGMFRDSRSIARITNTQEPERQQEMFGSILQRAGGAVLLPDVFDTTHDDEPHMAAVRAIIPGLRKYWERAHILSASMFPIVFQDAVIGDISFSSSTRHSFDAAEAEFLRALVSQTAITIKGMRLFRDLESSREELRQSEERFRSLVQNASDLVTVIEADTTITYQSPSITRLLGHAPADVTGTRLADLLHIDDVARTLSVLQGAMKDGDGHASVEARMRHRDGSWRHVEFIGTNQFQNPAIGGLVLNIRDVTERKSLEQQLRHQATHDPLTKLANRTRFADRLQHGLLRASISGKSVAVLFMDLDNFKGVNDSLGHAAGDELLTQVAERVQACLRPNDTVARLGGDEFAILLEDVATAEDATAVTSRIFASLQAPFELEGKELIVRASVGISISGEEGAHDADSLLRDADVAMYVAKSQGKGCFRVFEENMQVSMMQRLELLADLQRAVERNEFVLHYQPMVLLQTGQLFGVEALVRWQHPKRGLVAPTDFVPLAEESGAIIGLGKWVLDQACAQAADWQRRYPSNVDWTMSVNVSVKQLQHPSFVLDVARAIRNSGLHPRRLILEITESVMMHDVSVMMERLHELKDLGVRLAIDDFGTGYSSLSYLRQFPFDLLKIDKSFIDDVGVGTEQKELTRAIIELGKTLDLELVAEGIEHGDQLSRLQSMDCELGQGFYFAQPLDTAGIDALFESLEAQEDAA
jgi:diguanylate cyclase (GGDEF)-like protein/PAS domain S-box-containing protein